MALLSLDEILARTQQGYMRPQNGVPDDPVFSGVNLGPGDHISAAERASGFVALMNYCAAHNYTLDIPEVGLPYELGNSLSTRLCPGLFINLNGRLKAVGAEGQHWLRQAVFKFGNMHPYEWKVSGGSFTWLEAGTSVVGSKQLTIAAGELAPDSTGKIVGGIAMVRSVDSWAEQDSPAWWRANRVTAYDAESGVVTFEDEFDEAWDCVISMGGNDTAVDLQDEPLFIADRITIAGQGGWESPSYPTVRTAAYKCNIDLAHTKGKTVFYGNGWSRCLLRFKEGIATRKIADLAGNSHYTPYLFDRIVFEGDGQPDDESDVAVNSMAMNEQLRGCILKGNYVSALNFNATSALVSFYAAETNTIDIDVVDAPNITATPVRLGNPIDTDGTIQAANTTNKLRLGQFFGGAWSGYYVVVSNAAGSNSRNTIEGKFYGTPSAGAVHIGGDGHMISPSSFFESGALIIEASGEYHPTNLMADELSFPGGITGSTDGQRIRTFT